MKKILLVCCISFVSLLSPFSSFAGNGGSSGWIIVLKEPSTSARSVSGLKVPMKSQVNHVMQTAISRVPVTSLRSKSSASTNKVDHIYGAAIRGFSATLTDEVASEMSKLPEVQLIRPDRVMQLFATEELATKAIDGNTEELSTEELGDSDLWGLDRIDQSTLPLNNEYTYAASGRNVHAYILDTGINLDHEEFTGRIGNGYSITGPLDEPTDCNGHGTHVAGTVGGTKYGVAKNVTIHGVRVFKTCSGATRLSHVLLGMDWVIYNHEKPAVVNISLGGSSDPILDLGANVLTGAGVVVVTAAGNENAKACDTSPGRASTAFNVGATTRDDKRSEFSNFGSCMHIFAPGSKIKSASYESVTGTKVFSGTSMAAPHVTGAVALQLAITPTARPEEIRKALLDLSSKNKLDTTTLGESSPNRLLRIPLQRAHVVFSEFKDNRSFLCMTMASATNGADVTSKPCDDSSQQQWHHNVFTGLIRNKLDSNYCLNVQDGQFRNGGNVAVWSCIEGHKNMTWDKVKGTFGPRANPAVVIDAYAGGGIGLWGAHGRSNQSWTVATKQPDTLVFSEFKDNRSSRCITMSAATNGANVTSSLCSGSLSQLWRHEESSGLIRNKLDSNYCLDVQGGQFRNGGNVAVWSCTKGHANMTWNKIEDTFRPQGHAGVAIDAYAGGNIGLWGVHGRSNQSWTLTEAVVFTEFKDQATSRCIEMTAAANGANVRARSCNGAEQQQWHFDKITGLIRNKLDSNYCLNIQGGAVGFLVNVDVWSCSEGAESMTWVRKGEQFRRIDSQFFYLDSFHVPQFANGRYVNHVALGLSSPTRPPRTSQKWTLTDSTELDYATRGTAVSVLSVKHSRAAAKGAYFNFNIADMEEALGRKMKNGETINIARGGKNEVLPVVIWNASPFSYIGYKGEGHGRRVRSPKNSDWHKGDTLYYIK